jgi:hypothetical protein
MADDDQFNLGKINLKIKLYFRNFYLIDTDSEDIEEDEIGSDDDTGFFPIEESAAHASQSNNVTTTTTTTRTSSEQSTKKYSTGLGASNNHLQDNNFEYVGKIISNISLNKKNLNLFLFSIITRSNSQIYG